MAQRTILVLEDDLDGGEATQTIRFSFEGVAYEIDLNDKNAQKLRDGFAVWTGHARTANRSRSAAGGRRGRRNHGQSAAVRAWAKGQGLKVSERGRVSREILEAYEAANA